MAVDMHSLRRIRFGRLVEIGAVESFGFIGIKTFELFQPAPGGHHKRHINGGPGIRDQLCTAEFVDGGFDLSLQVQSSDDGNDSDPNRASDKVRCLFLLAIAFFHLLS